MHIVGTSYITQDNFMGKKKKMTFSASTIYLFVEKKKNIFIQKEILSVALEWAATASSAQAHPQEMQWTHALGKGP